MTAQETYERSSGLTQPIVSFLVPSYNAQDYLARCIDSLLLASEPCEIIIVNDGSTDDTLKIARSYEQRYDNIVVIDQENKGWGGGVNAGLKIAKGLYFKIVDSDDWIDSTALHRVLRTLISLAETDQAPDLLVTNYVYDHTVDQSMHVIAYRNYLPEGRIFTWDETRHATMGQRIMVHASWYLTPLLRESGIQVPEGVSYMDSYFVLHPLPYTHKLFYLDVNAYHYMVGRADQTVNVEVVKDHIDEQLFATRCAIDDYDQAKLEAMEPRMAECRMRYITAMFGVSTAHLFMIGTSEAIEKNKALWDYLKERDPLLHKEIKRTFAGFANRKTALGRMGTRSVYAIARNVFKFS